MKKNSQLSKCIKAKNKRIKLRPFTKPLRQNLVHIGMRNGSTLFSTSKSDNSGNGYATKYRPTDKHLIDYVRLNAYWKKWDKK